MELMKNKRVGKVLLIVEGGKHEFNLLKKIFVDVLGYTQIEKRRTKDAGYYVRKGDSHSVVVVINTKTSNIASIHEQEYLDNIYEQLIEKYDFDVNNAAIYYLFDRDPKSNTDVQLIRNLIQILKNSRENENYIQGGMLILSYPAIEAYEISNFIEESFEMDAKLGIDLKQYINCNAKVISMNKINEESIAHAGKELMNYLNKQKIDLNLDDFANTNELVFEKEEQYMKENDAFQLISMFSCVLMDLGLLTI